MIHEIPFSMHRNLLTYSCSCLLCLINDHTLKHLDFDFHDSHHDLHSTKHGALVIVPSLEVLRNLDMKAPAIMNVGYKSLASIKNREDGEFREFSNPHSTASSDAFCPLLDVIELVASHIGSL